MEGVSAGIEILLLCSHGKFFTAFIKGGLLNPVRHITILYDSLSFKLHSPKNIWSKVKEILNLILSKSKEFKIRFLSNRFRRKYLGQPGLVVIIMIYFYISPMPVSFLVCFYVYQPQCDLTMSMQVLLSYIARVWSRPDMSEMKLSKRCVFVITMNEWGKEEQKKLSE